MLNFYRQVGTEDETVSLLRKLIDFSVIKGKQKVSVKDPFIDNLYGEAMSPDGLRKLRVEKSGKEENALTYIVINLNHVSGSFFSVRGHHPDIKAYWKDNYNIVVETKKNYNAMQKIERIESRKAIIQIEYLEI